MYNHVERKGGWGMLGGTVRWVGHVQCTTEGGCGLWHYE